MLTILHNIIMASFIGALIEILAVIGIIWAIYTVFIDAISRTKQNKLEEIKQRRIVNQDRINLLNKIEGLIVLPVRNMFPGGFSLRWETIPTIEFANIQTLPEGVNAPKNNRMYQTIFGELKFNIRTEVISLFPTALNEFDNFINAAQKDFNKIASEETTNAYIKFYDKCEKIISGNN